MRKSFKTYLIIWVIALVIFNLVIFAIPSSINGLTIIALVELVSTDKAFILANVPNFAETIFNKYGGAFWPCYAIITVSFIGQLVCAYFAFKETNNQKFFYKVPLITISYLGLIVSLMAAILGMFIPDLPIWLAITICIIIFVITLTSLLKANLAATIISSKDDEIAESTAFMKEMAAKAKALWDADKSNEDLRKLYEAFRYANPLNLKYSEEITIKIKEMMKDIVSNKDSSTIKELTVLINNNK